MLRSLCKAELCVACFAQRLPRPTWPTIPSRESVNLRSVAWRSWGHGEKDAVDREDSYGQLSRKMHITTADALRRLDDRGWPASSFLKVTPIWHLFKPSHSTLCHLSFSHVGISNWILHTPSNIMFMLHGLPIQDLSTGPFKNTILCCHWQNAYVFEVACMIMNLIAWSFPMT